MQWTVAHCQGTTEASEAKFGQATRHRRFLPPLASRSSISHFTPLGSGARSVGSRLSDVRTCEVFPPSQIVATTAVLSFSTRFISSHFLCSFVSYQTTLMNQILDSSNPSYRLDELSHVASLPTPPRTSTKARGRARVHLCLGVIPMAMVAPQS
jgi:hypothetical protein